jgi:GTPase involved in cell partitioning and DNA repair
LVHVIDVSSASGRDPVEDYEVICRELQQFAGTDEDGEPVRLADKPAIAAANKVDALDDPKRLARLKSHLKRRGVPVVAVSAATGEGIPALLEAMWRQLAAQQAAAGAATCCSACLAGHSIRSIVDTWTWRARPFAHWASSASG